MKGRQTRVPLARLVRQRWPEWDAATVIESGEIVVEGRVVRNPRAWVAADAPIIHRPPADLAGRRKLAWAIEHFGVDVSGNVALDVGASTGGFTTALLDAGATAVYAVDAGHGQLLGSLRADPRVVNLERTNVGDLTTELVPVTIEAVSVDVSYLSLSSAVEQLAALVFAPGAQLLGLVKPMFELRLATIPQDPQVLESARARATAGVEAAGWQPLGADECPVRGGRGAIEFFVWAQRNR